MTARKGRGISRRDVLLGGGAALLARPAYAMRRPFDGVTLRGAVYRHQFFALLQGYIPEFEAMTGMKVELTLYPFEQYNALMVHELAHHESAFDFVNVTFFLASQWLAAGALSDLNEFAQDPNLTPASWMPADFVDGAQLPYRGAKSENFAYPWEGGAMIMGVSRTDVMERNGWPIPKTFHELRAVCQEVGNSDDLAGFVTWNLHHWCLVPYLQGFGGDVFKNAPDDVTPTLNSEQAVEALQFYIDLVKTAPLDTLSYTEDQARQSFATGRSNIFIHASSWIVPALKSVGSRVRETAAIAPMPVGPVHDQPAANSQGLGIPVRSRNRKAAWEFVKWALSPEMSMRMVREHSHATICRRSIITSAEYRDLSRVNGFDFASLYLDVLQRPARGTNYMAYRTVKEFPLVGEMINEAVVAAASGRSSARDALNAAQDNAVARLRASGAIR